MRHCTTQSPYVGNSSSDRAYAPSWEENSNFGGNLDSFLQGTDKSAVDAEAELQQNLAKKLGIAKKKQRDNFHVDHAGK